MENTYINILNELSKISSTNEKIAYLTKNKDVPFLKDFLQLMIDIRVKFWVTEFEIPYNNVATYDDIRAFENFLSLTSQLTNREVTGYASLEAINSVFEKLSSEQAYWLSLCIKKDSARLGIGRKVVNKVWPGLVLDFKVSLAESEDELDKFDFGEKAALELKLNGIRTIVVVRNGKVEDIYGRSGLPIYNFYYLIPFIESIAKEKSFVLDGEVHVNNCLENTMSLFGFDLSRTEDDFIGKNGKVGSGWKKYQERKVEIIEFMKQAKYSIFDYLDITEWDNQTCVTGYQDRRKKLINLLSETVKCSCLEMPKYHVVKDYDSAMEYIQPWIDSGLEGGILKVYDHLYSFKRDRNWLKIKEEDSITAEIIGWVTSKTKFYSSGDEKDLMMGAVVVKCAHPHLGNDIQFEVGTGKLFTEDFRKQFAINPDDFIGKLLDITCQRFTETSAICPRAEIIRYDRIDYIDL